MTDAALRELVARAASGDATARRALPGEARAQARDILAQGRFHEGRHHDGPLHGIFVRLGDWLSWLFDGLPGGPVSGWILIAVCVAGVATLARTYARGRREREWGDMPVGVPDAARAVGPDELERRAVAAEAAGDLDLAIRLRFAAGLLRLDHVHAIDLRPSLTSGDVGRALHSDHYDTIARTHDAITYGGHTATPTDTTHARTTWPKIITEAHHR